MELLGGVLCRVFFSWIPVNSGRVSNISCEVWRINILFYPQNVYRFSRIVDISYLWTLELYFAYNFHQAPQKFISYSLKFPMTLRIYCEQSLWVCGENSSLVVRPITSSIKKIMSEILTTNVVGSKVYFPNVDRLEYWLVIPKNSSLKVFRQIFWSKKTIFVPNNFLLIDLKTKTILGPKLLWVNKF